ncbi:MAG: hypothetical protein QM737_19850 [Ferruginibacter sp.]
MKNLFKATVLLTCFAIAIGLIQISCSKSDAQPSSGNNQNNSQNNNQNSTTSQAGKILFSKNSATGLEVWIMDYDGNNAAQVPIALPTNVNIANTGQNFSIRISPDGTKIFFIGYDSTSSPVFFSIYSCNVDGSNVQLIRSAGTNESLNIGSVY